MEIIRPLSAGTLLLLSSLQIPARAANTPPQIGATANWSAPHADSNETAYSNLNKINTADISRLGLAWSLDLPGEVSLESTPLAIDGTLYFTGSCATVYAVNGATGKLLWSYAPETWKNHPFKMIFGFAANRGVAYANGRIFGAALDGRLFALDRATGKLLWTVETTEPQSMQTITGAPRTFNGKVIIGNAGADMGLRGYVTAYDQATGKQLWRFYTAPGSPDQNHGDAAMEKAAATWKGNYWKTGTGGEVWDNITFDAESNRIYLGTGNGGPYNPEVRSPGGGDNLYTASVVALDADTGKYIWHYQMNPKDSWDFDCTQQMTLADLIINGKPRKVLMQAPKNGFFYVLDRTTGTPISAKKIGKVTWASSIDMKTGRPVEEKNIRYETGESIIWPSTSGAHSWMSQSFDPKTRLMYIPYMQSGGQYRKGKPIEGGVFVSGMGIKEFIADSNDGKGALLAWDPVNQKQVWKVQHPYIWNGGAMSSAGNLVFQGTAGGAFSAYNATTGAPLWKYDAGMGIIAAPMTYALNGKQYVSILAGYGGSAAIWGNLTNVGWKFASPRRLLTFALGGTAPHPSSPPRDTTLHLVDDPNIKINPADAAAGAAMFLACSACHGRALVSTGGPAPDLRESKLALNPDSFYSIVHDGALMPNGMPGYGFFSRQQIMQLYAYVRTGAREALSHPH